MPKSRSDETYPRTGGFPQESNLKFDLRTRREVLREIRGEEGSETPGDKRAL